MFQRRSHCRRRHRRRRHRRRRHCRPRRRRCRRRRLGFVDFFRQLVAHIYLLPIQIEVHRRQAKDQSMLTNI